MYIIKRLVSINKCPTFTRIGIANYTGVTLNNPCSVLLARGSIPHFIVAINFTSAIAVGIARGFLYFICFRRVPAVLFFFIILWGRLLENRLGMRYLLLSVFVRFNVLRLLTLLVNFVVMPRCKEREIYRYCYKLRSVTVYSVPVLTFLLQYFVLIGIRIINKFKAHKW